LPVSFLPPIHKDDDERKKNKDKSFADVILLEDTETCSELSKALKLEPFFFTKDGWDSNGFFTYRQSDIRKQSHNENHMRTVHEFRTGEHFDTEGTSESQEQIGAEEQDDADVQSHISVKSQTEEQSRTEVHFSIDELPRIDETSRLDGEYDVQGLSCLLRPAI
jgi:hypothetical protein